MTDLLYLRDAYATEFDATVIDVREGAIALDRTLFYPTGGGQPHDTGSLAGLPVSAVRKEYGIAAARQAGPDGDYTHSSFIYLIDRAGRLRALMPYGRPSEDYVHDVRLLLAAP